MPNQDACKNKKIRHIKSEKIFPEDFCMILIYKTLIILLCIGIVAILFGMAFIDCMSLFKIGFYTILSGALITSVGFVGIMFLLLGIGAAIIAVLVCILFILISILCN